MRSLKTDSYLVIFFGIFFLAITAFTFATDPRGSHDVDAKTKAEVFRVLDEFMKGFNARSAKTHYGTYHFPHYRLASGKLTTLESVAKADTTHFLDRLVASGWHHSKWEHRNIIQASSEKIHVDTQFTRYREDGTKIATYESLYVLTYENGRWGVKMRSSFAE